MSALLVPIVVSSELNSNTADLVRRFAEALAQKLLLAQERHGFTDGWAEHGNAEELRAHLASCVMRGDPLDVAAYAAFLWHHGETTRAAYHGWIIEGPHTNGGLSICFGNHGPHEGCELVAFVRASERDAAVAVVRELVEVKDTRESDRVEYQRRKPLAWEAARKLIKP